MTGNVFLNNASLTIEGGKDTTFYSAGWAPNTSDSSAVTFVHTVAQAGTVVTGDADKLNTLQLTPTVQLTGTVADNQFGYVSSIGDTGVTTSVTTGGTFNLVRDTSVLGSSVTLAGPYGTKAVQSGDNIVVTADGTAGGALNFNSYTTLTISSNQSGVNRTIDAEGTSNFFNITNSDLTLHSQDITYQNGKVTGEYSSGGAIYAVNHAVTLSGTTTFTGNAAGTGGAIHANIASFSGTTTFSGNSAEINGGAVSISNLTLSGTNTFAGNTAQKRGGAIIAYDATLSGTNTFSGNTVTDTYSYGGAIYADNSVVLSGSNMFSENSAVVSGGAICVANGSVTLSSTNEFNENSAGGEGGAIYAKYVTLSGDGSEATFTGNKANGSNNDIHATDNVTIQDAGTYSFGGGIVTESGKLTIQGGADVTLESGSITNLGGDLKLSGTDTKLNVVLNGSNRVDSDTVTTYANGATQLTAAGANTITDSAILNYSLVSGLANGWYLAGVGNFSGLDDFILLANQDDYAKSVKTVNSNGVWFGTLYYGSVYRYDNPGELQNTALTFDGAFGDGLQALATGDSIRIGGDVNSENEVTIGEGVTELSISSAAAGGVPVTVTATGNDHRFLNVEGDLTLNLTKVGFTGGKATNEENATGGALYAADGTTLTIHSDNAVFSNNTANFGGAIESNELALTGTSAFSENAANYEGGAIDTWTSTISGEHTFTNNSASERGGAIWAQELIFTGDNSNVTFSGNTAAGTANDIWIAGNGMAGLLTIEGNGTYELNGGIVAKNGSTLTINDSADVTFASHAVNNISGLTTINSNHVSFGDETTNTFAGGLALGAGVNQAVGGNVTVGNLLGVTYDATNETISQISFANVSSLTVDQGTKALISDTNGNTLTAKDFRGKLLGTTSFILGKTGGTELATVAGGDAYESLLYKVQIGYGLDDSTNYVMKSEEKQLDVDAIEGNARAARSLFGNGLFDVQTVEEARRNVSGATGELYASTATAQTNRLNYLNTMLANRLQQQNGETISSDSTVRGQSPSACCPKDSTSCRRLTNLWGSGYGIGGFASMGSNNVTGYDYRAGGMLIGADWQSSMADMGLFYGYGQTNIDSFASGLDSKDHTFGGYLKWDSLALGGYTTVLGDFSFSDAKGTRNYNGQGYRGDFDSMQSSVYLERGWKYQNGFGVNINPYAVLQYIGYNADEFSDGVLTVGDVNYESLRTKAGLRVDKDFCRNGNLWNLSTSFAWNHELLDTNADFVATTNFGGQAVSATIFGNNAGRDWFEYTAGAKVALTENVTLSGDYFLYVNERSTLNAGMGTMTWRF